MTLSFPPPASHIPSNRDYSILKVISPCDHFATRLSFFYPLGFCYILSILFAFRTLFIPSTSFLSFFPFSKCLARVFLLPIPPPPPPNDALMISSLHHTLVHVKPNATTRTRNAFSTCRTFANVSIPLFTVRTKPHHPQPILIPLLAFSPTQTGVFFSALILHNRAVLTSSTKIRSGPFILIYIYISSLFIVIMVFFCLFRLVFSVLFRVSVSFVRSPCVLIFLIFCLGTNYHHHPFHSIFVVHSYPVFSLSLSHILPALPSYSLFFVLVVLLWLVFFFLELLYPCVCFFWLFAVHYLL